MDDAIMAMTDRHKVFFRPMLQGKLESNLIFKKKNEKNDIISLYIYKSVTTATNSKFVLILK